MRYWTGVLLVMMMAIGGFGCDDGLRFELEQEVPGTRIDGDPVLNQAGEILPRPPITPFPLGIDMEAELAARDASIAEEVNLEAVEVTVTDGVDDDDDDLSWINSLEITVESTQAGSDLPEVVVAWSEEFPEGATSVALEVDDEVDLLPYVEEGVRLRSSADAVVPPDDLEVGGLVVLSVRALF